MPPKKAAGSCPVFLPHVGSVLCPAYGHELLGTSAPALAGHAFAITCCVAAYLYYIGDIYYAGIACPFLDMIPVKQFLPADWHYWFCMIAMVESVLSVFPTPWNRCWASFLGVCPASKQMKAAVVLPAVGAFYLKPFEGYAFLCFGIGWATAWAFTLFPGKCCNLTKWTLISINLLATKLCATTAAANGVISNFHHALFLASWLGGACAFASMGPAHGGKAPSKAGARGRSASAKRK